MTNHAMDRQKQAGIKSFLDSIRTGGADIGEDGENYVVRTHDNGMLTVYHVRADYFGIRALGLNQLDWPADVLKRHMNDADSATVSAPRIRIRSSTDADDSDDDEDDDDLVPADVGGRLYELMVDVTGPGAWTSRTRWPT